jgi:hypothetical protein
MDLEPTASLLPRTVEDLTPAWFTDVLGRPVVNVEIVHVVWGTATKVLTALTYDGERDAPVRVCVKGGFDERLRGYAGMATAYATEATFYRDIAPTLDAPLPRCHYAGFSAEEGQGVLILDDLGAAGCSFGDPEAPWTPDRVAAALEVQAAWHGPTWGSDSSAVEALTVGAAPVRAAAGDLLSAARWDAHFAQTGAPDMPEALRDRDRILLGFQALWRRDDEGPWAVAHGDAHIGNTYVEPTGAPRFLDWQAACRAPAFYDVAYFIGGALSVADRRNEERSLVTHYLQALRAAGGPSIVADVAWADYRRYQLHGLLWAVTPAVMQPIERVRAMADRHTASVVDHDCLGLLGV